MTSNTFTVDNLKFVEELTFLLKVATATNQNLTCVILGQIFTIDSKDSAIEACRFFDTIKIPGLKEKITLTLEKDDETISEINFMVE